VGSVTGGVLVGSIEGRFFGRNTEILPAIGLRDPFDVLQLETEHRDFESEAGRYLRGRVPPAI